MTAGRGIVHSEMPEQEHGLMWGFQLWVNLPAADKMIEPRYQNLEPAAVGLIASADAGALVRVIAGDLPAAATGTATDAPAIHGPGRTHTPITMVHATIAPGARLELPWPNDFNALAYALDGVGTVGQQRRPFRLGQLATFERSAGHLVLDATERTLEVLVIGGRPIGEPVAAYGPFVMNTEAELVQAVDDFRAGRLGTVPPDGIRPFRG